MADRRMFSKKIISSAKFTKMPMETQCLYFHLGLNADDDGVVEAYTIMRSIGATEDSLKILAAKGFIHVLNEDLVSFITDWQEHNKLRSDRKVNSIYKELLIQMLPEVKLLEPTERADRKNKNKSGTSQGRPTDDHGTTNGRPWDGIGQDRTGQDRLGKDNNNNSENIEEDVVVNIKKEFDKKTNGDISLCKLKILIEKKGLDTVNKYIAEYSKFNKIDKHNPEGFLIKAIEEEWTIPEVKAKKYNFAN